MEIGIYGVLLHFSTHNTSLNKQKKYNRERHTDSGNGIYLRVLYALQLDDDILWLAKEDKLGKALQDLSLKTREHASKKE